MSYSNLIVSTIRIENPQNFKNVTKIIKSSPMTLNYENLILELNVNSAYYETL